MAVTKEDLLTIVHELLIPLMHDQIREEVEGCVHTKVMKYLREDVDSVIRDFIERKVKGCVEVEIKLR